MNQAGSRFDSLSAEGKALASRLNRLSWKPVACWGSLKLHRAADDTFSVAAVEVHRAEAGRVDLFLVTETYDGRVELASIHTSELDAARAFAFHVDMIDPFGPRRGFGSTQYRTFEQAKAKFGSVVRAVRRGRAAEERSFRAKAAELRNARTAKEAA